MGRRPVTRPVLAPPSIGESLSLTFATSSGLVAINLVTGVITARLLQPSGRGAVAAILVLGQTLAWLSALGVNEAITRFQAVGRQAAPRIVGTALGASVLLGTLGVGMGAVLIPVLFRAQPTEVAELARSFLPAIYVLSLTTSLGAVIAGNHEFRLANLLRLVQPLGYLASLLALWSLGRLTPGSVLVASVAATGATLAGQVWHLGRTVGIGRPSLALLREALAYGLKLIGWLVGGVFGAGRLDVIVMPAVLPTAQIGQYSVALAVAGPVVAVLGSASLVILPTAARRGGDAAALLVGRTLRLVLVGGAIIAAGLWLIAPPLVVFVYGTSYLESVEPLRLLLPGAVLLAAATVACSGLQALDRPSGASIAQITGLATTFLGLVLTLGPLGILGAAMTSVVSSALTFVLAVRFLTRATGVNIRRLLSPELLVEDLRCVRSVVPWSRPQLR